jgi:hypothetical protein
MQADTERESELQPKKGIEMNTHNALSSRLTRRAALIAGCLMIHAAMVQGTDSWQTVDQVGYASTTGIAIHSGTLFTVWGIDSNNVVLPGLVRISYDAGNSWTSLSGLPHQSSALFRCVAGDPNSSSVYIGGGYTNGASQLWLVLQSTDGGTNWVASDVYQLSPNQTAYCHGLAADDLGNIYAVGSAQDSGGTQHWLVRKYYPTLHTWVTVDDQGASSGGGAGKAWNADYRSGVGLFVVGTLTGKKTGSAGAWTVRKSINGGTNWQTCLIYSPSPSRGTTGNDVAIDTRGNVYTVGTDSSGGEVLMSSNAGATWSNVMSAGSYSILWGVTVVPGQAGLPDDLYISGVQTLPAAPIWTTWQVVPGVSSVISDESIDGQGFAIAADPLGNVFVSGESRYSNGHGNWVTRKLAAPAQ